MRPKRLARSHFAVVALLVFGSVTACNDRVSLGANCVTPREACANKQCGDACSACSTASIATPDVLGYCAEDGECSATAASCAQVATGGAAGASGQGGSGGGSPGCGKAAANTGLQTGSSITVGGQARTYVLSVPTDYTGDTPLALVFGWHGANINGTLARNLFNLEANSNGAAIFAYPDGVAQQSGGWDLSNGSSDFLLFTALVDEISSSYCIDRNRIFSTGHSTGAMMSNDIGCYYGDVLRAIAPVEGTPANMAGRAGCTGEVAALVVHGQNDPVIALSEGRDSRDFWLSQNGCATATTTWAPEPACVEYQGCRADLPVVWCVHDQGHAWPSLIRDCDGGVCFDAGSAIWAFFSSFH
jgi:poly(3-hydroxybutyrate) depolymerase